MKLVSNITRRLNPKTGGGQELVYRNGFTLIELLVVVAIIAVLIAMLLPALSSARENARKAYCMSNLHQWGITVSMYHTEYQEWFPICGYPRNHPEGAGTSEAFQYIPLSTARTLGRYLGDKGVEGILDCPSNKVYRAVFVDPENPVRTLTLYQFFMNKLASPTTWYNDQLNLSRLGAVTGDPSQVGCMSDWNAYLSGAGWEVGYSNHIKVGTFGATNPLDKKTPGSGVNVLYVDGHVSWKTESATKINAETRWKGQDTNKVHYWW
jgi:prepilin-type N-terminal cleavage/methylation domain-containing protein/prepilin-type processing-associated H-X9-DG protein